MRNTVGVVGLCPACRLHNLYLMVDKTRPKELVKCPRCGASSATKKWVENKIQEVKDERKNDSKQRIQSRVR